MRLLFRSTVRIDSWIVKEAWTYVLASSFFSSNANFSAYSNAVKTNGTSYGLEIRFDDEVKQEFGVTPS